MSSGLVLFGFDLGAWIDRLPPWGLPAIILYGAMVAALIIPVAVALGRARAGWGWALLLFLPGIGLLALTVLFMARVLPRARWSAALGLLLLLPPVSIFFAWIFAFAPWKRAYRPLAAEDFSKPPGKYAKAPASAAPASPAPAASAPAPVSVAPAPRPADAEMDVKTGVKRDAAKAAAETTAPPPGAPVRDERTAPPKAPPAPPKAPPAPPMTPPAPAATPVPMPQAPALSSAPVARKTEAPTLVTPAPAPPPPDSRTVEMSAPPAAGRAWRLIGANDRSAALEFTLQESALRNAEAGILVGRSRGAGIVIADESVSRNHARFALAGGALAVEDLESMNGTWVNGQKLEANKPVPLAAEAIVEFGKIRLLVTDA